MDIRHADGDDRPALRDVAGRSFTWSYALSPEEIETIIDTVFADGVLADRMEDPDVAVLVAEDGGDVLGFAEFEVDDEGTIRWLHVDPNARGAGVGTALVERIRNDLSERDLPLTARLLEAANEGDTFLERFGLQRGESVQVEFGKERFHAYVYSAEARPQGANEPAVEVPADVNVDDVERPVDRDESIPGTEAPFFPIRRDDPSDDMYGFFCSSCGSTEVSGDGLDRLECASCGNTHLADEWDDAYL